jgi:hypothetical protein
MQSSRTVAGNNLLAALAIALIAVSCVNIAISFSFMKPRPAVPEGMQTSSGLVMACSSFIPQIEGVTYHVLVQGQAYYYDFNATGENESSVVYGDNSTIFSIDPVSGIVSFTPESEDVGLHYYYINATEALCLLSNRTYNIFNITNLNDPPFLISLRVANATRTTTYTFPINSTVYLFEDSWYNISLIADDPDMYVAGSNETLTYGKIPPLLFVLNDSTGNVTFMPLQADVGLYNFRFHVFDNDGEINQSTWTLLRVLNVNDNPVLQNKTNLIGGLGAMTVNWGYPFIYDVNATDEDGDVLAYHVDFINCSKLNASDTNCTVFGINATSGLINLTPPFADVGNYTVNYTVTDENGGVDWYLGSFSIAEWDNQPPNITYWEPDPYNVTMFEGSDLPFLVNVTDDYGIPFAGWYVDSVATGVYGMCSMFQSGYTFTASYEDSGVYNVTVVVSDGQYAVSHEWRLIVFDREPPSDYHQGRGGGGGGLSCVENWRCTEWSECSKQGLQFRVCLDLSNCSTSYTRPSEVAYCMYTPNPTCFDGIKNCHGGACEILADCGGPCSSCPTCSDGVLNCHVNGQCEESVDCGGPCKPCVTAPDVPVCGNMVCEAGELYECYGDCADLWIDVMIFVIIIILLVVTSILLYVYRKETVLLYVYRKMKGE